MVKPLEGKRALVTGAAAGIGRAAAGVLADAGAAVIGLDLAERRDGAAPILRCDLRHEADIVAAVDAAARRLGWIDILVNNAGVMREAPLAEVTADDVDVHFAVNVRGAILVTREAVRHLGRGGRIINLASELAYLGRVNASVYVATKAAILGLTPSWARELTPDILVNAVAPGHPRPDGRHSLGDRARPRRRSVSARGAPHRPGQRTLREHMAVGRRRRTRFRAIGRERADGWSCSGSIIGR